MSTPFRWDHTDLDALCGKLNDFSTILFSAQDPRDLERLWNLVEKNLIHHIQGAGLQTLVFDERTQNQTELGTPFARSADVILLRKKPVKNLPWNTAFNHALSHLPGAVLGFSDETPPNWFDLFDLVLEFKNAKCQVLDRSGRPAFEESCNLHSAPTSKVVHFQSSSTPSSVDAKSLATDEKVRSTPTPTTSQALPQSPRSIIGDSPIVYAIDVPQPVFQEISANVLQSDARSIALKREVFLKEMPTLKSGDVLVVQYSEDESGLKSLFGTAISLGVPVLMLAQKVKRQEDRVKLYDLGATAVLSKEVTQEEVIAAVSSLLRFANQGKITPEFPLRKWDEDFQRMSFKVKRDLFWKKSEEHELLDYYHGIVAHLLRRSAAASTPCGIMWIPLPDLSDFNQKGAWVNLMRKTLLQSLITTVRQRDVTFVYDDHLILISGDFSSLNSTYVLKRIHNQLETLGEKSVKIEKTTLQTHAEDFDAQATTLLHRALHPLQHSQGPKESPQ